MGRTSDFTVSCHVQFGTSLFYLFLWLKVQTSLPNIFVFCVST